MRTYFLQKKKKKKLKNSGQRKEGSEVEDAESKRNKGFVLCCWVETKDKLRMFCVVELKQRLVIFGKGEWKNISTHALKIRTMSQVASHAQKYFFTQRERERERASMAWPCIEFLMLTLIYRNYNVKFQVTIFHVFMYYVNIWY